jgi:hypothetical protein
MTALPEQNPQQHKWRSLLEFGPLIIFFGVNYFFWNLCWNGSFGFSHPDFAFPFMAIGTQTP